MKKIKLATFILVIGCSILSFRTTPATASQAGSPDLQAVSTQQVDNGVDIVTTLSNDGQTTTIATGITRTVLEESTDQDLIKMGIPPRPTDAKAYANWLSDYADVNVSAETHIPLVAEPSSLSAFQTHFMPITEYLNWGGYGVGTPDIVNTAYVAVKANFTVPAVSPSCTNYPDYGVGAWVGLGGRNTYNGNDLVQQGIGWCSPGNVNKFVPWTEFAGTAAPTFFCNQSNWTLNTGDVIYNNMSFQSSTNTAYFYMEDQTTGVKHACSSNPPKGWSFNGNVGECIAEDPLPAYLSRYGQIPFSNCQVELGSNSTWYPIGNRSTVTRIDTKTSDSLNYLQSTGSLGSDNMSFVMTFIRSY
ncbi:MAG: G1 family glutamic endopeptidase [Micrococcales bacterium]